MIDFDGYRPNVGIVICNKAGQVLWAKRFGQNSWQFPQGGINEGENIEAAMYRELFEEVGLTKKDVRLLWASKYWLKYKLPRRLVRGEASESQPVCIGQKQRWFLLQLIADESTINLKTTKTPEFDGWRWVSFWYPVRQVVSFKRDVYRKVMKEFSGILHNEARFERERPPATKMADKTERVEPKSFAKNESPKRSAGGLTVSEMKPNEANNSSAQTKVLNDTPTRVSKKAFYKKGKKRGFAKKGR